MKLSEARARKILSMSRTLCAYSFVRVVADLLEQLERRRAREVPMTKIKAERIRKLAMLMRRTHLGQALAGSVSLDYVAELALRFGAKIPESDLLYDVEELLVVLREVTNRLKLVMPCPGCSSHIAGDDEHVLGCTVARVLDKAHAALEPRH